MATDRPIIARHRKLGTSYVHVKPGNGGMSTVTTVAGSKYVVKSDSIVWEGQQNHTLSDAKYERLRELNNEMQELMTQTFLQNPSSTEADGIAQAKREVGRGIDKFLTLIGR